MNSPGQKPGNPGWLGNPFKWEGNGGPKGVTVQSVVDQFRAAFLAKIEADPAFKAAVDALKGKQLGYYQPQSSPNHAEVIRDYLDSLPAAEAQPTPEAPAVARRVVSKEEQEREAAKNLAQIMANRAKMKGTASAEIGQEQLNQLPPSLRQATENLRVASKEYRRAQRQEPDVLDDRREEYEEAQIAFHVETQKASSALTQDAYELLRDYAETPDTPRPSTASAEIQVDDASNGLLFTNKGEDATVWLSPKVGVFGIRPNLNPKVDRLFDVLLNYRGGQMDGSRVELRVHPSYVEFDSRSGSDVFTMTDDNLVRFYKPRFAATILRAREQFQVAALMDSATADIQQEEGETWRDTNEADLQAKDFTDDLGIHKSLAMWQFMQDVQAQEYSPTNTASAEIGIVAYAAPAPRDLLMGARTGTVASLLQHHGSLQTWMKHKPGAFAKKWSKRFSDQQHALILAYREDQRHKDAADRNGYVEVMTPEDYRRHGPSMEAFAKKQGWALKVEHKQDAEQNPYVLLSGINPNALRLYVEGLPKIDEYLAGLNELYEDGRKQFNEYYDLNRLSEAEGDVIAYIDNYNLHMYQTRGTKHASENTDPESRVGRDSPAFHARKHVTLQDAALKDPNPKIPKYRSPLDMMEAWFELNARAAANTKFRSEIVTMHMADGLPAIRVVEPGQLAAHETNDKRLYFHYKGEYFGGSGAYIHPDAVPYTDQVTEGTWDNKFVRTLEGWNAVAKYVQLGVSFFHHFTLTESFLQAIGLDYLKGKGNSVQDKMVDAMLNAGVLPASWRDGKKWWVPERMHIQKALLEAPQTRDIMHAYGLQMGAPTELHRDRVTKWLKHGIQSLESGGKSARLAGQMLKGFDKFKSGWDGLLWERMHDGMKAYTFFYMATRWGEKFPNAPMEEVYRRAAGFTNEAFGGLDWKMQVWASPKQQQIMRWTLLAADWTTSNLMAANFFEVDRTIPLTPIDRNAGRTKQLLQWVKQRMERVKLENPMVMQERLRFWRNTGIYMILLASAAQAAIKGLFGLDDEEMGWTFLGNNQKGSDNLFGVDITPLLHTDIANIEVLPGMSLRKMTGMKDEELAQGTRMFAHAFKQVNELFGYVTDPVGKAFAKMSPAGHTVAEQFFGVESPGWEVAWKDMEGWEEFGARIGGVAGQFVPFSLSPLTGSGGALALTFPVTKMTEAKLRGEMAAEFAAYANRDDAVMPTAKPRYTGNLAKIITRQIDLAKTNGMSDEQITKQMGRAVSLVKGAHFNRFWEAADEQDVATMEEEARKLVALGVEARAFKASAKNRLLEFSPDDEATIEHLIAMSKRALSRRE